MSEKTSQQVWPTLHRVGSATCSMGQRVKIEGGIVRQGIGFEVGPQILDGIQFRRVGRKKLHPQSPALLSDEVPGRAAAMPWQPVPDDEVHRLVSYTRASEPTFQSALDAP